MIEVSVNNLKTTDECDQAIEILAAEKLQVERKARNLSEALEDRSTRVVKTSEGIASTTALINGFNAAIAVITDEREKRKLELKVDREETKLKALENRQADYGTVSLIEDQVDLNQLSAQIPILEDAIQKVTAHKATL